MSPRNPNWYKEHGSNREITRNIIAAPNVTCKVRSERNQVNSVSLYLNENSKTTLPFVENIFTKREQQGYN